MQDDYYTIKAEAVTRKHIQRVSELLGTIAVELIDRGAKHDKTKLVDPELAALARMQQVTDSQGFVPYNSPEYVERMEILKPMLAHHYAANRHHPEHYSNGVTGMTLLDIVEMFADWKAAAERSDHEKMNISHAAERYKIDSQLEQIFKNTADYMGFKYE